MLNMNLNPLQQPRAGHFLSPARLAENNSTPGKIEQATQDAAPTPLQVQLCKGLPGDAMRCDAMRQGHHRGAPPPRGKWGKSGDCLFLWVLRVLGYLGTLGILCRFTCKQSRYARAFKCPRVSSWKSGKADGPMGARDPDSGSGSGSDQELLPIRHVCASAAAYPEL